jgi:adenylate kinase family enzyme
MAVVEYYSRFGKVRSIDATGTISEVYAQSKDAVLPQVELVLGTKGSGKTTVARTLCERTNAAYLNFLDFAAQEDMQDIDEEELVCRLIQRLAE